MDGSYDLIVVGSGIAGLYAALLASAHRRVLLVTKGQLEESNTRYAQGGIAVAMRPGDSPELHLRDSIVAGDGLCDANAVSVLTREAPACIRDLLDRGVKFDLDGGELAWTLEAAHSLPRVLHAGGDATGAGIERTLAGAVRASDVHITEHALATELLLRDGRVSGLKLLLTDGSTVEVAAPTVVLATGGAGQLFARTTNPAVATGDGLALAYRAGARLTDVEFMQFHPTAIVLPGAPSFLISEAVRGEGGILRDHTGKAFMADYHPDRELAPRDVVARAIHSQMEKTDSDSVDLDIRHMSVETVQRRFPSILRFCREHGINPTREPIPVAPAAHYLMGGVATDANTRTTIPGLLACGEVACTGVHGANRLASNSLLEGLVFARRAVATVLQQNDVEAERPSTSSVIGTSDVHPNLVVDPVFRPHLQSAMWRHASVVRSAESLLAARSVIDAARVPGKARTVADHEASNLALLASLAVQSASLREESRGGHFRSDFPSHSSQWQQRICVSRNELGLVPVQVGVPVHA